MSNFPNYVEIMLDEGGEEFSPDVLESPMERGPAKLRLLNRRVTMELQVKLLFESRQSTLDFDTWYFDEIKRIGWFNLADPRSGVVRSMRFKGGALGRLTPAVASYAVSTRTATLEYLR